MKTLYCYILNTHIDHIDGKHIARIKKNNSNVLSLSGTDDDLYRSKLCVTPSPKVNQENILYNLKHRGNNHESIVHPPLGVRREYYY